MPHVEAQIAALEHRFGTVQVIENETFHVPGSDPDLPASVPGPARPLRRADAAAALGQLPDGFRSDRDHSRAGVRARTCGGRRLAPRAGRRSSASSQNPQSLLDEFALVPPGQVAHPTAVDVLFDAPGRGPGPYRFQRHRRPGRLNSNRDQPDDHRAGVGDRRHAADRPGVGRRLHRAGPASHALPRDARVDGGDRPQRPARAGGQRGHRRRRGCRGWASGWVWWPGWPTARTTSRARTTSSHVRPAVDRDRAGDGAGGGRHVLRRRPPGPRHHPCARWSAPWPVARRRRARSTARSCPA